MLRSRNTRCLLAATVALAGAAVVLPQPVQAAREEVVKYILTFDEENTANRFFSQGVGIPDKRRLLIDEVSIFVQLHETTDAPPVKAVAYLTTGQVETETGRFNVKEPLGTIDWLDKSPTPLVGATQGVLRTETTTFTDEFVSVTFEMNEFIQLGFAAGPSPISHAVIVGRLVRRPRSR